MKFLPAFIAFVILVVVSIPVCRAREKLAEARKRASDARPREKFVLDVEAFLHAIRQVETGNRPELIGGHGERSAYQFKATTWAELTRMPFKVATTNPTVANYVARQHVSVLERRLWAKRIEPMPEFMAAAWRYGDSVAASKAGSDYAQHVANLYAVYAAVPRSGRP